MTRYLCIAIRYLCVFTISVIALFQYSWHVDGQTTCGAGEPQCWKENPLEGHGPASGLNCSTCYPSSGDGSNRRVITIRIDSSWNIPGSNPPQTVNAIWNAVNSAINMWNNARDGASPNGYYMVLDQGGAVSPTPDINIRKQTVASGGGGRSGPCTGNIRWFNNSYSR